MQYLELVTITVTKDVDGMSLEVVSPSRDLGHTHSSYSNHTEQIWV